MGEENGYLWKETIECDECENEISIEYSVYEYPTGAFNNDDVRIEGGKEKSRFGYNFHESLDPNEDY